MRLPRIMIAAPKSGSGKTILTCGLLNLFKERGEDIASYKCGPDYIDPMFHRSVIGVPGRNLDSFFSSKEELRDILAGTDSEAAVIEGVMGIYDGISGTGAGSCYDVAAATGTPLILVIDVKGMGQTMLSVIKGILMDDELGLIRGVVLNRITPRYYKEISPHVRDMLDKISGHSSGSVRLIGGIPHSGDIRLESRHLGLMMPDEIADLKEQVRAASELIEEYLDLGAIEDIMDSAEDLETAQASETVTGETCGPVLAVARDEAFCFYYEENLNEIRRAGIRVVEFSPLHDRNIPEDADGLLLGGGYPELYADVLSANTSMMRSIKSSIEAGMPSLAECGGFMTLMDELEDKEGKTYRMAGAVRGRTWYTGRLGRFGYVTVTGKDGTDCESLMSGLEIKGHEFHYYDSTDNGSDAVAVKPGSERSWECIHAGEDHIWGYPHLYYPSCRELIRRFRNAMVRYSKAK